MTVTELLAEICNRAGEGYQNYTERAASLFKRAITVLAVMSTHPEVDAPALYRSGIMNPALAGKMIYVSELLAHAGLTEGSLQTLRYSTDGRATMQTELDDDNDIVYTAITAGTGGNLIGVEYVKPIRYPSPISVVVYDENRDVDGETVVGKRISVSLELSGAGLIDCDAAAVITAINSQESSYYVVASLAAGVTGAGQMVEMAEVMLEGGAGGTGEYKDLERITASQYQVSRLNPNLLNSQEDVAFYLMKGIGAAAIIELIAPPQFGTESNIEYSLFGWTDALITPVLDGEGLDTTNISTAFSPRLLEEAINAAAQELIKEIQA